MSIALGFHSGFTLATAGAGFMCTKLNINAERANNNAKKLQINKQIDSAFGAYVLTTTLAACSRICAVFNLAYAFISPTSRAANIGFSVTKWTVAVLWGAGILGVIDQSDAKSKAFNFYMTHAETMGQAASIAITVGLAIAHVIGPVGIVIGLVGPALYFATLAAEFAMTRRAKQPEMDRPRQQNQHVEDIEEELPVEEQQNPHVEKQQNPPVNEQKNDQNKIDEAKAKDK